MEEQGVLPRTRNNSCPVIYLRNTISPEKGVWFLLTSSIGSLLWISGCCGFPFILFSQKKKSITTVFWFTYHIWDLRSREKHLINLKVVWPCYHVTFRLTEGTRYHSEILDPAGVSIWWKTVLFPLILVDVGRRAWLDIWVTKRLMLVKVLVVPIIHCILFYKKEKTFFFLKWGEGVEHSVVTTKNTILNEISQTETNKQTKNDIILHIRGIEKQKT